MPDYSIIKQALTDAGHTVSPEFDQKMSDPGFVEAVRGALEQEGHSVPDSSTFAQRYGAAPSLKMSDITARVKNVGYSGLTEQERQAVDAAFPKSQAAQWMDLETMRRIMDAQAGGANGPREVATAVAESQAAAGDVPGTMQMIYPGATADVQMDAMRAPDPQSGNAIFDIWKGVSPLAGDLASLFGRSLKGLGSGLASAAMSLPRTLVENVERGVDPSAGFLPNMAGAFSRSFVENMASPTGFLGAPSSALLAAPALRGSQLLSSLGYEGLAARAAGMEGAHPFISGAVMNAPYSLALGAAGEGMNTLGGQKELPVAMPDASAALMLSPRTIGSLVAGGGPVATQPERSLGSVLAGPAATMALGALGGGLSEAGLRLVPGVNAIIDREMKYANKVLRKDAQGAGREMASRLAEVVDATGFSGIRHGVGAISDVSERAAHQAGMGYGAVGEAIAPNSVRAAASHRPIIMDPEHPYFGKALPDPSMGNEWLGWVAPPGKEGELASSLGNLRSLVPSSEAREMPGVVSGYTLPEGAYIDVGRGIPMTMNDLFQEARQNAFQKAAHGHPAYATVPLEKIDKALMEKFQSAHGTQGPVQLFRGKVPDGSELSPVYWPDLAKLRVPANVRSGSTVMAGAGPFQDAIRNDFGDVVTRYMYNNNAAIDRAGVRELQKESGRLYKFAKLAEQLSVEDATKRVGQEPTLMTWLRNVPALQYRVPMAIRGLGLRMQQGAAPASAGINDGR